MRLFTIIAAAALLAAPVAGLAAGHAYQVGEVVIYHNPYDGSPARKGRVTRVDPDKIWVDFKEFQPGLNIAEASKILYLGTNAVDDWTQPVGGGEANGVPAGGGPGDVPPAPAGIGGQPGATPPVDPPPVDPPPIDPPPVAATDDSVFGVWGTLQVGHTVTFAPGDGWVYQRQEIGAQAGDITIRPDGTFTWNSKSQGVINGRWRQATADELRGGFGPTGIRLLRGESGWDYNVQRRPRTGANVPDSIAIWTSGYQVNGYRVR
ncbi:MAG TPA: hypothetical protein VG939_12420, partial [Caulobacteraceae bacterium]|nr:hypothetical protein [Caulobacteraceae bacterium]